MFLQALPVSLLKGMRRVVSCRPVKYCNYIHKNVPICCGLHPHNHTSQRQHFRHETTFDILLTLREAMCILQLTMDEM